MQGDAADLLKEFFPGEDWPRRRVRLEQWQQEYEREQATQSVKEPSSTPSHAASGHRRGLSSSSGEWAGRGGIEDPRLIEKAFKQLSQSKIKTLYEAVKIAKGMKVNLEAIAYFAYHSCREMEKWIEESNQRHLASCTDPACDAVVCRAARGLPPLTKEEIEADKRKRAEAKQREKEEFEERVKDMVRQIQECIEKRKAGGYAPHHNGKA
jgi:hypothetical protein